MNYELIITVVNRGFSENVMEASRLKGATGGTILNGRGSTHAHMYLDTYAFQPEKEIVLIVCKKENAKEIMQSINETIGLTSPGSGVSIAIGIDDVVGIDLFKSVESITPNSEEKKTLEITDILLNDEKS